MATNEAQIISKLCTKYPPPAYALIAGARNMVGFASRQRERYIDALVVSCYPSRGLGLYGFEVKTNTADWRREAADPEKAEAFAQFCHRWWVVAPKGVVPTDELPERWGLMELKGSRLFTTKEAPALDPKPLSLTFLSSILRKATKGMVPESILNDRIKAETLRQEKNAEAMTPEIEVELHRLRALERAVKEIESASGITIHHNAWSNRETANAIRAVMKIGSEERVRHRLRLLRDKASDVLSDLNKAVSELEDDGSN